MNEGIPCGMVNFLQGRCAENILIKKRVQWFWEKVSSTVEPFSITHLTKPQKFSDRPILIDSACRSIGNMLVFQL